MAYGTTKLSGKLIDLVTGRKNDDSWAKKISGKADHVGFDDVFRKIRKNTILNVFSQFQ